MDLVLCAITSIIEEELIDEQEIWMDLKDFPIFSTSRYRIIPLINHPHSDKENGQNEIHYHADTRYNGEQPHLNKYVVEVSDSRPLKGRYVLKELPLIKHFDEYGNITPVHLVSKSKLKHKCIHKGKCPHRGMDLTGIEPVNGIITCPLHGLQFDNKSKKLLNDPTKLAPI